MSDVNNFTSAIFNNKTFETTNDVNSRNGFAYSTLGINAFELQVAKFYKPYIENNNICLVSGEGVKIVTVNNQRYVAPVANIAEITHMVFTEQPITYEYKSTTTDTMFTVCKKGDNNMCSVVPVNISDNRINFIMQVDEDVKEGDTLGYNTTLYSLVKLNPQSEHAKIVFIALRDAKAGTCCLVTRYKN